MLWDGDATDENIQTQWKETVDQYKGSVAVGSTGIMYLFPKLATAKPLCIRLYDVSTYYQHSPTTLTRYIDPCIVQVKWEVRAVAWAISAQRPTNPLVIFAPSSIV